MSMDKRDRQSRGQSWNKRVNTQNKIKREARTDLEKKQNGQVKKMKDLLKSIFTFSHFQIMTNNKHQLAGSGNNKVLHSGHSITHFPSNVETR